MKQHFSIIAILLLWERERGKPERFREEVDQLPPVLLYGSRY
jgi:hypothetical protein